MRCLGRRSGLLAGLILVPPTPPAAVSLRKPPFALKERPLADVSSSLDVVDAVPMGFRSPLAVPAVIGGLFRMMTAGAAEIEMVNFVQQSCCVSAIPQLKRSSLRGNQIIEGDHATNGLNLR